MTDAATLRRASVTDAPALAALFVRARRAAVPAIPPLLHDEDDVRGWMGRQLAEHEVWIAELQGAPVGFVSLGAAELGQLYLEPACTGRGLGTQLLDHAKARRPEGLALWAFVSNLGARRFYERHGFVAVGGTDGDNEEGAPDVRYAWRPDVAG